MMWASRLTATLRSAKTFTIDLAAEEVDTVADGVHSVISRSSFLNRTGRRSTRLHKVTGEEDALSVVSNLTFHGGDPRLMNISYDSYEEPSAIWQKTPDLEEQLAEKEMRVNELLHVQKLGQEELQRVQRELYEIKLKYHKESREWKLTQEDYLAQTHRMSERIEAYDRDLNDEDMIRMLENDITYGAQDSDNEGDDLPPAPNVQRDDDTVATNKSNKSNFSLPSWRGGTTPAKQRDEQQQKAEQEYMELLQTKLLKYKHKMQVMHKQCEMLEETLEEETKILRKKLKKQERETSKLEIDLKEELVKADYTFRQREQQLLAQLESKQERLSRLEALVDELRDAADRKVHGALNMDEFASIVALNSMKESFDVLSRKKDEMESDLGRQIQIIKAEMKRLRKTENQQKKLIERLQAGDALSAFERGTTIGTVSSNDVGDEGSGNLNLNRLSVNGSHTNGHQSECKSNDTSVDGGSIPSELKDDLNDLMDSISMFAESEFDKIVAERRTSLDHYGRPPEHHVESDEFRKQAMQVQDSKWVMMDDDRRKKHQQRLNRFL
jgi:hypothetical protein